MKENIFEIKHSKFGSEEFQITSASYNLYLADDKYWELTFYLKADKALIRAKKLQEVLYAKPNFEATAILSPDNLQLQAGKIIYQKEGYDYERDEHLSNVYYFEHESVDEVEIELVEVKKDWIIANIKGIAIINGSNGKKTGFRIGNSQHQIPF